MRTLLTGGSSCGKSVLAETIAETSTAPRYYIATMIPDGEEDITRINRHRAMRADKGFITIERYTSIANIALPDRGTVLLECICNLVANEMFNEKGAGCLPTKDGMPAAIRAVLDGIASLDAQCDTLVVVTNDVGSDGECGYDETTLRYIDYIGQVNARLAAYFENVYELVCGVPLVLRGSL